MFSFNASAYNFTKNDYYDTLTFRLDLNFECTYTLTEPGGLFTSRVVTVTNMTSTSMFDDKWAMPMVEPHPVFTKINSTMWVTFNGTGSTYINGVKDSDSTYVQSFTDYNN